MWYFEEGGGTLSSGTIIANLYKFISVLLPWLTLLVVKLKFVRWKEKVMTSSMKQLQKGIIRGLCGTLKRVVWYFEEGHVVIWRWSCGNLKRVAWSNWNSSDGTKRWWSVTFWKVKKRKISFLFYFLFSDGLKMFWVKKLLMIFKLRLNPVSCCVACWYHLVFSPHVFKLSFAPHFSISPPPFLSFYYFMFLFSYLYTMCRLIFVFTPFFI